MTATTLTGLGWRWAEDGAHIRVSTKDRGVWDVFVPVSSMHIVFSREMARAGCPMEPAVGGCHSAVGLFGGLKKAARKAKRRARRAIRKARRRVTRGARRYANIATLGQARRLKRLARSKLLRRGLMVASLAVPALAPAAAALEAANRIYDQVKAGRNAAAQIQRGFSNPQTIAAMAAGRRAEQGLAGVVRAARGGNRNAQQLIGGLQRLGRGGGRRRRGYA